MSDTKTYVVPDNLTGNNDNLATMAMMSNGAFGNGMWNNPLTKCYKIRYISLEYSINKTYKEYIWKRE